MLVEMVTKHDLDNLRQLLLTDLAALISQKEIVQGNEFLRSKEARKLLGGISNGTLQNLRVKGHLKPSKIEGVFYYKQSEIVALLNAGTEF